MDKKWVDATDHDEEDTNVDDEQAEGSTSPITKSVVRRDEKT